jgi:hypothetical protein
MCGRHVAGQEKHRTSVSDAPERRKSGPQPGSAWATLRKTCSGSGWPSATRTLTHTGSVVRPWGRPGRRWAPGAWGGLAAAGPGGRPARQRGAPLLATPRPRAPGLAAHARQRAAGSPGDGLAIQARTEPLQARRARAGCGDDDCIARAEVDVTRTGHRVPEADPQQEAPREDRGDKALDGAIAAVWARPAGHAAPGDASGPHQESVP